MKDFDILRELLISIQRALWEMIDPSTRAIAVGFDELKTLKIIFYLDREPNEDDYETIEDVAAGVCADLNFSAVDLVCTFSDEPFSKLDNLESWVYLRKE